MVGVPVWGWGGGRVHGRRVSGLAGAGGEGLEGGVVGWEETISVECHLWNLFSLLPRHLRNLFSLKKRFSRTF